MNGARGMIDDAAEIHGGMKFNGLQPYGSNL